jgi:hypothetical protein
LRSALSNPSVNRSKTGTLTPDRCAPGRVPTAAARHVANGQNFSGSGAVPMPIREKGSRSPGSQPARPYRRRGDPLALDRLSQHGAVCSADAQVCADSPLDRARRWREMDSNSNGAITRIVSLQITIRSTSSRLTSSRRRS